jgi:hypothetical protein
MMSWLGCALVAGGFGPQSCERPMLLVRTLFVAAVIVLSGSARTAAIDAAYYWTNRD